MEKVADYALYIDYGIFWFFSVFEFACYCHWD